MDFGGEFEKTIIKRNPWENIYKAGKVALKKKDYDTAEKQFKLALKEAGKFGDENPRLGNIYFSLAEVYRKQQKYDDAESNFKCVIDLWENTLGKDYSGLIEILDSYAELLAKIGRKSDSDKIRLRSRNIRNSQDESTP